MKTNHHCCIKVTVFSVFLHLLVEKEQIVYIPDYCKTQMYNSAVSASIDSLRVCVLLAVWLSVI